jgi:WD40 repeat protein
LERKAANKTAVWIALAGAAAIASVLVGIMVLVANHGVSGSRKEQTVASQDTRSDPRNPVEPIGEIRRFVGHTAAVVDVAFSPNGQTAVSGGFDKILRLWDVETGRELRRFEGHADCITGVAFTPDGLHVVSSGDTTVRLWDVASGKEVRRFQHMAHVGYRLTMTLDGTRILSCSDDKLVHVWDLQTGNKLKQFNICGGLDPRTSDVGITSFSADGRRALSVANDNVIRLWDVEKGTGGLLDKDVAEGKVKAQDRAGRGAVLSADGRAALVNAPDNHLLLYDVQSGKLIRSFQDVPAPNHNTTFSPDGRRLLTGYYQQDYAGLWNVETGKEIYRIPGSPGGIARIVFSPDGKRALSAGRDGTVRLWGLPD